MLPSGDYPSGQLLDVSVELFRSDRGGWRRQIEQDRKLGARLINDLVHMWARGTQGPQRADVFAMIIDLLLGQQIRIRQRRGEEVSRAARALEPRARMETLLAITAALRRHHGQSGRLDAGHASLFTNTAQVVWHAGDAEKALALTAEADQLVSRIPSSDYVVRIRTVNAIRVMQIRRSDRDNADFTAFRTAIVNLNEAGRALEASFRNQPDFPRLRLKCALEMCDAWTRLAFSEGPFLESYRAAADGLLSACGWWLQTVRGCPPTLTPSDIVVQLSQNLHSADADVIREFALRLIWTTPPAGMAEIGDQVVSMLSQLRLDDRAQATLWLSIADVSPVLQVQLEAAEAFLAMLHLHQLDVLPGNSRAGLARKFRQVAVKLGGVLNRNGQVGTALFLRWEATRVEQLLVSNARPEPQPTVSSASLNDSSDEAHPSDAADLDLVDLDSAAVGDLNQAEEDLIHPQLPTHRPPDGSVDRLREDLDSIRGGVLKQNPLYITLGLRGLASISFEEWGRRHALLAELLTLTGDWQRSNLPVAGQQWVGKIDGSVEGWIAFRGNCLTLADVTAQRNPEIRAQILSNLANLTGHPVQERLAAALAAASLAQQQGRRRQGVLAMKSAIQLSHELGDSNLVSTLSKRIADEFLADVAHSSGGVTFYELIKTGSRDLERIASWLSDEGYFGEAFQLVQIASGWMSQAMAQDSGLVEEFDALRAGRAEGEYEPLYRLMELRIVSAASGRTRLQLEFPRIDVPSDTAHVLFLARPHSPTSKPIWALLAIRRGDTVHHHGLRLPCTEDQVAALIERTWLELRPSRLDPDRARPPRATRSLTTIYQLLVEPYRIYLTGITDLVFTTNGLLARIPLHAARGPDGYLAEHFRCRYSAYRWWDVARVPAEEHAVMVGGWDPQIGAPDEAREVRGLMQRVGLRPQPAKKAIDGRALILTPGTQLRILHVAAHGQLQLGPQAAESVLQLSPTVAVRAGEWTRSGCDAAFSFLNACRIGTATPHAGDLTGFPLALRVRGGRASLTALGDISPWAAHEFARLFYRSLAVGDTLTAYMMATRSLIQADSHPGAWAPYAYEGEAIFLQAPSRGSVARKSGAPADVTCRNRLIED